jgi:hypothetical protein
MRQFYVSFCWGAAFVAAGMFVSGGMSSTNPVDLIFMMSPGWILTLIGVFIGRTERAFNHKVLWTVIVSVVLTGFLVLLLHLGSKRPPTIWQIAGLLCFFSAHIIFGMLMRVLATRKSSYQSKAGFAAALFSLALLSLLMCISAIVRAAGRTY